MSPPSRTIRSAIAQAAMRTRHTQRGSSIRAICEEELSNEGGAVAAVVLVVPEGAGHVADGPCIDPVGLVVGEDLGQIVSQLRIAPLCLRSMMPNERGVVRSQDEGGFDAPAAARRDEAAQLVVSAFHHVGIV